jgi:hypothetical protein
MSTQAQTSMALGVLLTTCHISGTALVPPAMNHARPHVAAFPRFFALTGATITAADGTRTEEPVVIVNRDLILALGRPDEGAA